MERMMSNVIPFPLNIRYRVAGINRDGRMIVQALNSPEQFMMYAENILANLELNRQLPKSQISWLYEIARINRGEKSSKPTVSIY